jgi:hypothetical protein
VSANDSGSAAVRVNDWLAPAADSEKLSASAAVTAEKALVATVCGSRRGRCGGGVHRCRNTPLHMAA